MRLLVSFICLLSALAGAVSTRAAGTMERYSVNVGKFDKVNVVDNAKVVFRCVPDSAGMIVFNTTEELADAFLFSNNSDGTLRIQVTTKDIDEPHLPVIYIYSDFLVSAVSSSDYVLRIEKNAPVPKFTAKVIGNGEIIAYDIDTNQVDANVMTGNGTIVLSGKTAKAQFRLVGTGMIQADELEADQVNCSFMGSGSIGCWALKKLDARGVGSTKIYYKGNPTVKKVGGGKIFPMISESE